MTKTFSKRIVKAISMALTVCILCTSVFNYVGNETVVEAKTIAQMEKELKELESQQKNIKGNISDAQKKQKSEKEKQDLLNSQIKSVEQQIALYQEKINVVTDNIATKELEITQKLADIEVNEELFAQRIRAMYMANAANSTLSTLLESKSFAQFLNTTEIMARISQSDKDLIELLTTEKKDLAEKKVSLEANQTDLKKTKTDFDAKNKSLDGMYDQSLGAEAEAKKAEKTLWLLMEKNKAASEKMEKAIDAAIAAAANTGKGPEGPLLWPLPIKSYFSSYFGWRTLWGRQDNHTGIDLPAPAGTTIRAAESGEVIFVNSTNKNNSYGYHVIINHDGGLVSLYGHMSSVEVSLGQKVKRGDRIGGVGTTGNSSGNHLHFEIRFNGVRKNPLDYVKQPTS